MAQSLADDRYRDRFPACDGGPAVPAVVEREGDGDAGKPCDVLQVPVDLHHLVLVLPSLVAVLTGDDGQEVAGGTGPVLVEDVLHLRSPLDGEQLSCLLPAVGEVAVPEVAPLQVGHVDEGHAACVETEEEHVARVVQDGMEGQVEVLDPLDVGEGDAALDGLVDATVDMPEGHAVSGEALLDGQLVVRAQDAHIERGSVAGEALTTEVGLIQLHHLGIDHIERQVDALAETHETVECGLIGLARTDLAQLLLALDLGVDELEDAVMVVQCRGEAADNIVDVAGRVFGGPHLCHALQAVELPVDIDGKELQIPEPQRGGRREQDLPGGIVPLVAENLIGAFNSSEGTVVNQLKYQRSFSIRTR